MCKKSDMQCCMEIMYGALRYWWLVRLALDNTGHAEDLHEDEKQCI